MKASIANIAAIHVDVRSTGTRFCIKSETFVLTVPRFVAILAKPNNEP